MSVLWKLTRNRYSEYALDKLEKAGFRQRRMYLYRFDLRGRENIEPPTTISGPDPYEIEFYLGAVLANRISDGQTIGYLHFTSGTVFVPEVDRKMSFDGFWIYRVLTDPLMRRQGVAKNLLKKGLSEMQKEAAGKADYVYAIVALDNMPSRKLFEGMGFVPVKELYFMKMGKSTSYREKEIKPSGTASATEN